MVAFTAAELQRRAADVQKAALREPVFLTYHEKPRFVMLSMEDYARLGGVSIVASPEGLPESVAQRLQELADMHPHAELEVSGGLADTLMEEGSRGPHP
jgi:hypothetical protein